MGSHRLQKLSLSDIKIEGYSVAGEETAIGLPELNVCFDVGKAPDSLLAVDNLFISHTHMDHVANLAYYCSQRDFREMAPGTVLLHESKCGMVEELLDFWGRFDGSRPPANIIGLTAGREYEIRRNLIAFAFDTNHTPDSLGYTIIDRRQKLKEEYLELEGQEIAKLRKEGKDITYTLNVPLVTYLGDTMSGDFQLLPCVKQSKILITECTFFEEDHHDRANAGKHFHIDHLVKWLPELECEHILLTHLSRRTHIGEAKKIINQRLAPEVASKVVFMMDRFNGHAKNE